MGGLGIEDITIGYSSTGAAKYIADLNTKVIVETSSIITNGVSVVKDVIQTGWQGEACDAFNKKLDLATETLKEKLKELEALFNASMAAQEETYYEQDTGMADTINSASIF